ncbi:hypothetical protein B0T14DRAFT_568632 [Immersiella caudata]|uniref:Uncharacterized protein n=1 Tax=Immersiella caudata TaxID=314043 RepID=A0AA39WKI7_9PEZI|nr:hypothetical protein B0T14DRAFT_568632 [Immersiella caudata]
MTLSGLRGPARAASTRPNGLLAARSIVVGLSRVLFMGISSVVAAPLHISGNLHDDEPEAEGASLWVLYVASLILVLSGGAFAGLTIALMGQDGIYLQVVAKDPNEPQQKNARRVYELLQKGKHWVLVTLLLANVIVNETLPVVLDRCLGGGVAAVVGATFLIVIFGEVVPQSICVRYGLQIGGYMSKPVLVLMYLLAPLAWPTAKLLDKLLGEDHGTVYKKSGLKTLVTLHKNLGDVSQRLNQDEVTIISAVLDLKEKPVANVMTPMDDVFIMSEDTVLDEKTMDMILSAGYSRIPIHETSNPTNFVGMLLVKILITYDPEDGKLVKDFPLATLPETRPETSCLDIVNFFQEGKSHMVLVSEYPGEDHGALGVVTLEDVIEELIGEEIIDESDVYIDVHKAIRRLQPAPKARVQRQYSQSDDHLIKTADESTALANSSGSIANPDPQSHTVDWMGEAGVLSTSPKLTTFMMRRSSAGVDGHTVQTTIPVRANFDELRQHLKHLGPSNPATNPKNTRSTTVKVKPGILLPQRPASVTEGAASESTALLHDHEGDENTSLLRPQVTGKDGIQALRQSYGATSPAPAVTVQLSSPKGDSASPLALTLETAEQANKATQTQSKASRGERSPESKGKRSSSSGGSAQSFRTDNAIYGKQAYVRSGSITENVIESRGVRKVVLETTSSNDEDDFAVVTTMSSPEQTKAVPAKPEASVSNKDGTAEEPEEEDEEGVLSPDVGDEGPSGKSDGDQAGGTSAGGSGMAGGSGGKKKSRRKKRKGGKS